MSDEEEVPADAGGEEEETDVTDLSNRYAPKQSYNDVRSELAFSCFSSDFFFGVPSPLFSLLVF